MHFFTSINKNYIPKARVLAKSVKQYCKDAKFSLVFSDSLPEGFVIEKEPFDEVITLDQLGIPVENLNLWIFMHSVVELCTAVKGQALYNFLRSGSEKVVYLDPDIAVFSDLNELENLLDQNDIVLTPHQTYPEENDRSIIIDNEICSMKHGVYNLGFLAVKSSPNGLDFAKWWRDRLVEFCYDDIPSGLFTDQRWGDLVPCLFEGVNILRDPSYNVATWNINYREVKQTGDWDFTVNDIPLKFYHFSGFDSGAQECMLKKYGRGNVALWNLRNWYLKRMDEEGQKEFGGMHSCYDFYSNGEKISKDEREMLKNRRDVQEHFLDSNPFLINADLLKCYYDSYQTKIKRKKSTDLSSQDYDAEAMLQAIYNSRSWKLTAWLRKLRAALKRKKSTDLSSQDYDAEAKLQAIYNSRSWKYTTWLRKLRVALKGE
jgi:hypothetical protein